MSKLATEIATEIEVTNIEPTLPTWFTSSFNERIVAEVTEELRGAEKHTPSITEVDKERMAQYRADLQRRMAEIRMRQEQLAPPPVKPMSARKVSVNPKSAPPRSFTALKTTGLVMVVLAVGAGIGYLVSQTQLMPIGVALLKSASQNAQALFAAKETVSQVKGNPKTVVTSSITVGDVSGAIDTAIPLGLVADQANTTIIYKVSGVPAGAYLTEGTLLPDGDWSLKQVELPNANIVVGGNPPPEIGLEVSPVVEATGEVAAPAKPIKVAVEPPLSLQKSNIRIEPAASKPGMAKQP